MKPNDLGKKFVVEECQKIEVNHFLRQAKNKLKEMLLTSEMDVEGIGVELTTSRTGFGGKRYWFKCPVCGRRVGTLFLHPISMILGCRKCLDLEYTKRRYRGMLEARINLDLGN